MPLGCLLQVLWPEVGWLLGTKEAARARRTCRALHAALSDNVLWRRLFTARWRLPEDVPSAASWVSLYCLRMARHERWRRHEAVCTTLLPDEGNVWLFNLALFRTS